MRYTRGLLWVLSLWLVAGTGWGQDFIQYNPYAGGAVTNPILAPDGSAAAPSYSFSGATNYGMFRSGSRIGFTAGGTETVALTSGNVFGLHPNMLIGWGASVPYSGWDTILLRDAANTLALRNSTAAQRLNIYGTWTDASNYTRIGLYGSASGFTLATSEAGTGAASATRGFTSIQGSKSKALTDAAAATPFMTVAVPTNGWVGGELGWTATSVSGADQLTTVGRIRFAGATTTTTPVCTVGVIGTDLPAVSAGGNTLVCTWTNVVAAQTCALSVTCTNDLAAAQAITLYGRADMQIPATLVFP